MGDDRKRKQRAGSTSTSTTTAAAAAAGNSNTSAAVAADAPSSTTAPRYTKYYAIAAITDPSSPPWHHNDATSTAAPARLRSPVSPAAASLSDADANAADVSTTRRAATDMSVLPRSVMELVFSYAVKDLSLSLRPAKCRGWKRVSRAKVDIDRLARWRSVCVYWRELIDAIVAQFKQRRLKVNLSYKSREQILASAADIAQRGEQLVDLRVALYGYYDARAGVEAAGYMPWTDVLRACPNLQRLDLSEMAFLTRAHMSAIVAAAAQHCLKLQALALPLPVAWTKYERPYIRISESSDSKFALADDVLMQSLEKALARWCLRGRFGGLRQLATPNSVWTSDAFVAAVAAYCPHIEVLDGWKLTYLCDGWGPVTCDDEWAVADRTWRAFCQACTSLREFNWVVVPFADAFFRPFGAVRKPLLTDLLIDFADSFGAEDLTDLAAADPMVLTGQAAPRTIASSTSTTAPAGLGSESTMSNYVEIARPYSSDGLCALVRGLPFLLRLKVYLHPTVRINVDVFDDAFLLELAQSTPHLEQLRIIEAGQYDGLDAIQTISERGLSALASMPSLSDVAITVIETVSADGALAFVRSRSRSQSCSRQRNVKIGVMKGIGMCIVNILKTLAKDMDDSAALSFGTGQPFAIVLENMGLYRGCIGDSKAAKRVEDKMYSLQTRLAKLHPGLKCQLTLAKERSLRRDVVPFRIAKFAVFSATWTFPDALGGTFYRGDIAYDPKSDKPFEMVVRVE